MPVSGAYLCCGAECGQGDIGGQSHVDVGAGVSFSEEQVRSGKYSFKGDTGAGGTVINFSPNGANTKQEYAGRAYFRWASYPTTVDYVIYSGRVGGAAPNVNIMGIGFDTTGNKLKCAYSLSGFGSPYFPTFVGAGFTPALDTWYRIDFKIDRPNGTVDAIITVDGDESSSVTLEQANTGGSNVDTYGLAMGKYQGGGVYFLDDVLVSDNLADYPIGPGYVHAYVPTADGTHNVNAVDRFERGDSGTDIDNTTTDAFALLNSIPFSDNTAGIKSRPPCDAGDYVELLLGPADGSVSATAPPRMVSSVAMGHAGLTDARNYTGKIELLDVDVQADIWNWDANAVFDSSNPHYQAAHFPTAPYGGAWNVGSLGHGDFNNLKVRYRTEAQDTFVAYYIKGIVLEAEFSGDEPPPAPPADVRPCTAAVQRLALLEKPAMASYVAVEWPSGTQYYATTAYGNISPFRGIKKYTGGAMVQPRIVGKDPFLKFEINGDIRTENIDITLNDRDDVIKNLFEAHGAARCEMFFYFPDEDVHKSAWWGQILKPAVTGRYVQKTVMTNGYRSKELSLPNGFGPKECRFAGKFGGVLDTLDKVRTNGCPYDKHLGGSQGLNDPTTGQPFKGCPGGLEDCLARFGHKRYHGGYELNASAVQSDSHPGNMAYSKGNAPVRNRAATWIFGYKVFRGSDLLIWAHLPNQNHPENSFIRALYRTGEGPLYSVESLEVNDKLQGVQDWWFTKGERGQSLPSPYPGLDPLVTFSGTALWLVVFGWVDPNVTGSSLTHKIAIGGNSEVAVWTDDTTFTRRWTNDVVWGLMEMYTNQKCGLGYDGGTSRFHINKYISASYWTRKYVTFRITHADGEVKTFGHRRATLDAALAPRPAVEQIIDVCRSARISVPFQNDGKYDIETFHAFSDAELAAAPVFSDHGAGRNIAFEGTEAVVYEQTLDDHLVNEIALTFDEKTNFDIPRTIFGDDPVQKVKAAKLSGAQSRQTVPAQFSAVGIRNINQAIKSLFPAVVRRIRQRRDEEQLPRQLLRRLPPDLMPVAVRPDEAGHHNHACPEGPGRQSVRMVPCEKHQDGRRQSRGDLRRRLQQGRLRRIRNGRSCRSGRSAYSVRHGRRRGNRNGRRPGQPELRHDRLFDRGWTARDRNKLKHNAHLIHQRFRGSPHRHGRPTRRRRQRHARRRGPAWYDEPRDGHRRRIRQRGRAIPLRRGRRDGGVLARRRPRHIPPCHRHLHPRRARPKPKLPRHLHRGKPRSGVLHPDPDGPVAAQRR